MLDSAESRPSVAANADRSAQWKPPRLASIGRSSLLVVANTNASGLDGKRETVDRAAALLRGFGAQWS
jgi:hypothetical protein